MLANLFRTAVLNNERRMPDAPGEFLAGWVYGVSWQKVDIRNDLMACIAEDENLTNDMYDGMHAYEAGDMDKAGKLMKDAKTLYAKALNGCPSKVTDPLNEWGNKVEKLTERSDWEDLQKTIYFKNKEEITKDSELEFKWWDSGNFFNAGMFGGRIEKVFLDNAGPEPTENWLDLFQ